MKDGRTHLAHKQEIAVDLDTGAIVSVTVSGGAQGDTEAIGATLGEAGDNLDEARVQADAHDNNQMVERFSEVVADKGYHSNAVLWCLGDDGIRTYISEPERGRRSWKNKQPERDAVYANRRRIRGKRGKALLRTRGERLERPFAHLLETGGMRRTHLRRRDNILKRVLVHVAGFNLALIMRSRFGIGKPRQLQGGARRFEALRALLALLRAFLRGAGPGTRDAGLDARPLPYLHEPLGATRLVYLQAAFTTGC